MSKNKIIFPKLYDANGDLSRQWFIFYTCTDRRGKRKRFFDYSNLAKYNTLKSRYEHSEKCIRILTDKLNGGWLPGDDRETFKKVTGYGKEKNKSTEKDYSIEFFLNKFLNDHELTWRKKTLQGRTTKMRFFIEFCNDNKIYKITEVTKNIVEKFVKHLHRKNLQNLTINQYISTLKTCFNKLIDDNILIDNPFSGIARLKEHSVGKQPFNETQKSILKNYISDKNPDLWLFIEFIFYCFIRPGELRQLRISDIDIYSGKIFVRGEISKNKKNQFVCIPNYLLNKLISLNLFQYKNDGFLFSPDGIGGSKQTAINYFYRIHRKILRELKISSVYSLYSWKSTGVVVAVKAGINIKDIKEQLRHSSLDMTDIYLKSIGAWDFNDLRNRFPTL